MDTPTFGDRFINGYDMKKRKDSLKPELIISIQQKLICFFWTDIIKRTWLVQDI